DRAYRPGTAARRVVGRSGILVPRLRGPARLGAVRQRAEGRTPRALFLPRDRPIRAAGGRPHRRAPEWRRSWERPIWPDRRVVRTLRRRRASGSATVPDRYGWLFRLRTAPPGRAGAAARPL